MQVIRRIGRNQYYTETKFLGIWMLAEQKRFIINSTIAISIAAVAYAILYI